MTRIVVFLLVLLALPLPTLAQTPTPPGPLPLPTQQMYEALATQNANLATLPADLTSPNGIPLLPNEDGVVLFGYIKWLISPTAADEWAGPFAPVFQHIGIGLWMSFALMGVYGTVYVIANIGGWVTFLLDSARKIMDAVFQAAQAAPVLIILIVILFIAYNVFGWFVGEEAVQAWVDEQLDNVLIWVNDVVTRLTGGT